MLILNVIPWNDLSMTISKWIIHEMEKSFAKKFMVEMNRYYNKRTQVVMLYQNMEMMGVAIYWKCQRYYYLDKFFILDKYKSKKLGSIFLNMLLELLPNVLWRTSESIYQFYLRNPDVEIISKDIDIYMTKRNTRKSWEYEDLYMFLYSSAFT